MILLPLQPADLHLVGEHPVLSLLADYPVLSSMDHGWVRVSTDGNHLWVHAVR